GDSPGVFAWVGVGGNAGRLDAGSGVTVAVLDTGVSDTPALNRASKRLVDGVDTSRLLEGGDARTTGRFTDGFGHGTFMANLVAAGVDLYSRLPGGSVVGRKHRDRTNGFNRGSGTSESTSVTAGAIAVLLSGNPDAKLTDVKPLLRLAADNISGGGRAQG